MHSIFGLRLLIVPAFLVSLGNSVNAQAPSNWQKHPRLGQCFANAQAFIQVEFGEGSLKDENIVTRQATPLSAGSVWVVDHTPATNFQWYLLQAKQNQLCLRLFVPNAVQADLQKEQGDWIVKTKTQAAPGFPEKVVTFKRGEDQAFKAVKCAEASRELPCSDIFEWSFYSGNSLSASHGESNVPDSKKFELLLKRDISAYVTDDGDTDISVTVEMLRDFPTQVGVAFPKYYVWVEKRDKTGTLLESAAARLAAVEKKKFEVIQYYEKKRILAEPALMQKIFPRDVYEKILKKARDR